MIPKLSAVITLDPWLTFLAQWLSPRQVTHVGANLLSIDQSILNGVELLVIDADPAKKDQVQRQLPGRHFQFFPHIVAERTGPIVWYQASNSAESGLLAIDQLQRYWQNIKTVEVQPKHAFALDDVYATLATQPCWLWVDCFPALFILQGARNALAQANVVLARQAHLRSVPWQLYRHSCKLRVMFWLACNLSAIHPLALRYFFETLRN